MHLRQLERHELATMWTIDRSEVHHCIYQVQGQQLVKIPSYFAIPGWPPEQVDHDTPLLAACFDRGGRFIAMFDAALLVGVAVVDTIPLGPHGDHRQLKYLYVSRPYRGRGIGRHLFANAQAAAREQRATALYISATPTEHTVDFYLACGAVVATPPEPALYALEPDDIHLLCPVGAPQQPEL